MVLALVLGLLGSWVLSLDVSERETIRYDFVTELTGVFETEQAPNYIEYNPSTNWTGYYTDRETKYYAGVDATLTAQRNQYQVNMAPTDEYSGVIDLNTATSDADDWVVQYWYSNNAERFLTDVSHTTVSTLLSSLNQSDYTRIQITADWTSWTESGGFWTFAFADMIREPGGSSSYDKTIRIKTPGLTGGLYSLGTFQYDASTVPDPILALSYDRTTGYANLYYDTEMTQFAGLSEDLGSIHIVWGGEWSGPYDWSLGSTGTEQAYQFPAEIYMDVRNGVKLQ